MFGANKSTGLALAAALLLSQTIAFADESSSTTVETSNGAGTKSASYKAEVGENGAKITSQKNAVQANADGSVTSAQQKESHSVGLGGSAHSKSTSATTVSPDGSTAKVKEEHTSVNP